MILRRWAILLVIVVVVLLCCLARSEGAVTKPEGTTLKEWVARGHTITLSAETPVFGIACFEHPCDLAPIPGEVDVSGPGLPVKPYCRVKREPP